ncbi:hypothetical protein [Marinobacterium sp. BA1]|uniref:hypothetical protein n=1 Tax=Marinobacterium sp. BA1 TaxID=3138931 RepID=UPI0032E75999
MKPLSVKRFCHDRWHQVGVKDLTEKDLIFYQGQLLEVTGQPEVKNGRVHLPARLCQAANDSIVVAVGDAWKNREATIAVMDYTNAACRDFGDGTEMIGELEAGPGAIYSPRLTVEELEAWCMANLGRFEAFFESNEAALDEGDIIKIEPWW